MEMSAIGENLNFAGEHERASLGGLNWDANVTQRLPQRERDSDDESLNEDAAILAAALRQMTKDVPQSSNARAPFSGSSNFSPRASNIGVDQPAVALPSGGAHGLPQPAVVLSGGGKYAKFQLLENPDFRNKGQRIFTKTIAREITRDYMDYIRRCRAAGVVPASFSECFESTQLQQLFFSFLHDTKAVGGLESFEDFTTDHLLYIFSVLEDRSAVETYNAKELQDEITKAANMAHINSWKSMTYMERARLQQAAIIKVLVDRHLLQQFYNCSTQKWAPGVGKVICKAMVAGIAPSPFRGHISARVAQDPSADKALSTSPTQLHRLILELSTMCDQVASFMHVSDKPDRPSDRDGQERDPSKKPSYWNRYRHKNSKDHYHKGNKEVDKAPKPDQKPGDKQKPASSPAPPSSAPTSREQPNRRPAPGNDSNAPKGVKFQQPPSGNKGSNNPPRQSSMPSVPASSVAAASAGDGHDLQAMLASRNIDFRFVQHDGLATIIPCEIARDAQMPDPQSMPAVPFLMDCGASFSTVSRAVVDDWEAQYPHLRLISTLPKSIGCSLADTSTVEFSEHTTPLKLQLHLKSGPLLIGPISLVVIETSQDSNERLITLGRGIVEKVLGVTLDSALESAATPTPVQTLKQSTKKKKKASNKRRGPGAQSPPSASSPRQRRAAVVHGDWSSASEESTDCDSDVEHSRSSVTVSLKDMKAAAAAGVSRYLNGPLTLDDPIVSDDQLGFSPLPTCNDAGREDHRKRVWTVLTEKLDAAVAHGGLLPHLRPRYEEVLQKHQGVFALDIGDGPPASVPHHTVYLKPGAEPICSAPRPVKPQDEPFLRNAINVLVSAGILYPADQNVWGSPAFVVRDPSGKQRMVIDLRRVNAAICSTSPAMPEFTQILERLAGCSCFFTADLLKGFWQIEQDEEAQHVYTIVTPFGKFASRRMLQGDVNAPAHFQAILTRLMEPFYLENAPAGNWVDDLIGGGRGASLEVAQMALIELFDRFCTLLSSICLRASADKLVLCARSVKWFGLIIDKDGVSHDPARIEALLQLRPSQDAGELMQFLSCLLWFHRSIPHLSAIVSPLEDLLRSKLGKES
jgi:hypothetical protein